MQIAVIQENFDITPDEAPKPELPPGGAIIRVIGCGLCGSDLDKFVHRKAAPGSVLGHEVVGVIEKLDKSEFGRRESGDNEGMSGWAVGDRLTTAHHVPCGQCRYCFGDSESMCRQFKRTNLNPGGFAQYVALTADHLAHTAFKVPTEIDSDEAACVEPLACVLRAAQRGGVRSGMSVLVVGLGFIGLMAAQVYLREECRVYGAEPREDRRRLALAHGFMTDVFPSGDMPPQSPDCQNWDADKVDTVFLTVVNPQTVALALQAVRDGGNIILFASASGGATLAPSALYFREINLITSYSPALRNLREAARMIFDRSIRVKPLTTHTIPLGDIGKAFALYRSGEAIKVFITMEGRGEKPEMGGYE